MGSRSGIYIKGYWSCHLLMCILVRLSIKFTPYGRVPEKGGETRLPSSVGTVRIATGFLASAVLSRISSLWRSVHRGFYFAYHNTTVRPVVINAVKRTRKLYGKIPVMVTGHSMGGAMASFCALDLAVNCGIHNVQLTTFGQPRVGNAAFASYFREHVPKTIRVTNGNDIVPHLPPYYSLFPKKTYHHFPREVWIHNIGVGTLIYMSEQICDGSGEDPSCSRSVSGDSITDHMKYLGIYMQADTWGSCRIVMDYSVLQYQMDLDGNIVVSKDPVAPSIIQPISQEDNTRSNVQN